MNEKDFESELAMLKAFSRSKNPHLIKLLATFRLENSYYLLFPYAESNLRQYWKETPLPLFDKVTVTWTLRQCMAIACGLFRIHEYSSTKHPYTLPSHQQQSKISGEHLYGRHGDIKPENILWSVEKTPDAADHINQQGLLLIADFGLMEFHRGGSRSFMLPGNIHGTPTYAPPERELRFRFKISRAYDIWSLGCVYLEFITWLLCGWKDLDRFSERRGMIVPVQGMESAYNIDDDTFFTIVEEDGRAHHAILRESVKEWMKELHEKPRCSGIIHEFLDLISEQMLVVDPTKRITCGRLNKKFQDMLSKAKKDADYLTAPRPSQSGHSILDGSARGTTQSPGLTEGTQLRLCPFVEVDEMDPGSPQIPPSLQFLQDSSPPWTPML
jgi:serine/threonine protein kinase